MSRTPTSDHDAADTAVGAPTAAATGLAPPALSPWRIFVRFLRFGLLATSVADEDVL